MFTLPDQTLFLKVCIFIMAFLYTTVPNCEAVCRIIKEVKVCIFSVARHFPAGQMVYTVRQRCGRQLAIEAPTDADVVSTVPESATPAALGYAQQVSLPNCK